MQKRKGSRDVSRIKKVIEVAFRDQPHSVLCIGCKAPARGPSGFCGRRKMTHDAGHPRDRRQAREVVSPQSRLRRSPGVGPLHARPVRFQDTLLPRRFLHATARKKGTLRLQFQGEARLSRPATAVLQDQTNLQRTEGDGTQELTLYVDRENSIPIGVVVKEKWIRRPATRLLENTFSAKSA